jgi:hypothetical protein
MADSSSLTAVPAHHFHSPTRRQSLGLVDQVAADFELFNELSKLNAHPAEQSKLRGHMDHILRMTLVLAGTDLNDQGRDCVDEIRRSSHAVIQLIEEKSASAAHAGE